MAVFTPRALQIPNMRTDYSAENSAFSNLGQTLGNMPSEFRKEQLNAQKQQTLLGLGQDIKAGNYSGAASKAFALGDTQGAVGLLGLQQKQLERDSEKAWMGGGGGLGAPAAPVALGSPNEVENRFLGGVQKAGLTNPNGLAAVAAYGKSESGYSPSNVNKTWSDPSESGAAGTSGGIMSWRAERLQNLQNFARQRGEQGNGSPETQAAFLASEDPTLVPRLNAAKTPQEANQIMADAWRFAGYNRPGQGEFARREGLTGSYAQRYAGQPAAASPGVQVAETEADVQRLEQEQAARPADAPAPGAANAQGFAIPGTGEVIPQAISTDPAVRAAMGRYVTAPTERTRAVAKQALDLAVADAKQKQAASAPTDETKNFEQYRREEMAAGRPAPTRADYLAMKRTQINNTNTFDGKGESKFNEALGAAQAKRWNGYIEEGDVAQGRLADIQTLRDTSRRLGSQGSSANLKAMVGPFAESLGIKVDGLSDIQLYESITQRLAPTLRAPGSGSTSDIEFKGFLRAIGPLSNTPAAREMILDTYEAASRNDVARSQIASRLASGEINRGQAEKELRSLPDPMTSFKEFRKHNPDLVGQALKDSAKTDYEQRNGKSPLNAPNPAAPPTQTQPVQRPAGNGAVTITNPTTGQRLMLTPDGKWAPFDG